MSFSYKAMSKDSKYPEKMEVLYGEGTTLENLKDTLLKETILPSAWTKYKNEIIIEKDGIYTFAFHAVSDAYMDCLYLTDINVDVYPFEAPGASTGLDISAGEKEHSQPILLLQHQLLL